MRTRLLVAMFASFACSGILSATPVTVVFRVDVYAQFFYATMQYNPAFIPENINVTATFDDAPAPSWGTSTETVFPFGIPLMWSSLTSALPYDASGINPALNLQPVEASAANFNDGQGEGYTLQFQGDQSVYLGVHQAWAYNIDVYFNSFEHRSSPPPPSDVALSSNDLLFWINELKTAQSIFDFSEYSERYDTLSGTSLEGIGYSGQGTITDIQVAPEPTTSWLIFFATIAFTVLTLRRARRMNEKRRCPPKPSPPTPRTASIFS